MIEKDYKAEETGLRKFLCTTIGKLLNNPPPPEEIMKQLLAVEAKLLKAGSDWNEEKRKIEQQGLSTLKQAEIEKALRPVNAAITRYKEASNEYVNIKAKMRQTEISDCPTQKFKKLMRDFFLQILQEPALTK
ncbi:MAG: hypothetical protein WCV72_04060 [Patescibacteria group bacterium]